MKFTQLIAIVAVSALTISAFAQGGGGGGGRGQGGMRMMGGGGMMPSAFLLQRDDVQEDLKLTSEQKDKLDVIRTKTMEKMREMFTGGGGGGGGRGQLTDEMRKTIEKMGEETTKEVNTVLTADQAKRLKQIGIQMAGSRAVTNPEVAKELGLSEKQSTDIKVLMEKQGQANRALMQKMRDGELDRDAMREKQESNNKILDAEVQKILTEAQKTKMKEMGGAKFTRSDG